MSGIQYATLGLFISGVANVLLLKWADETHSIGIDGVRRKFQHPFIQVGCMFFGQFLCAVIYQLTMKITRFRQDPTDERNILTAGNGDYSPRVFVTPAICEMISAILLFSGLTFTTASSYTILQCAAVIFVGMYSVIYLNQTLNCFQWVGSFIIACGAGFLVMSDYMFYKSNTVITGDLFILMALVFQALKYVLEEKHVKVLDPPTLAAIGWQGFFGLIMISALYIPLNFLKAYPPFGKNAHGVLEDYIDAMSQLANNYLLLLAHGFFIISVAIHNYCGVRLAKKMSSVSRVHFNNLIAVSTWSFACLFSWEGWDVSKFFIFIVILCGSWIYRNKYFVPLYLQVIRAYSRRRYGEMQTDQVTSQPADVI